MNSLKLILSSFTLAALIVGLHWQVAEGAKCKVPNKQQQAETEAIVREVYVDDVNAANTSEKKVELASRLFQAALDTNDDINGRYVLLCMSRDLAAENGEREIALKACNTLESEYDVDPLQVKTATLKSLVSSIRERSEQAALTELLHEMTCSAVRDNNYPAANELAKLSLSAARKSKSISATRSAHLLVSEIPVLEAEFARVAASKEELRLRGRLFVLRERRLGQRLNQHGYF
jgi:hypothetical protein